MMRALRYFTFVLWFAATAVCAEGDLQVDDAWVREGPPNAQVLGGFMHLRNSGAEPIEVTGVTSPAFERVEMHRSVIDNGMAKMIAQEKLTVPAGGELTLAPGGYHLMLFAPKQPVRAGQKLELVLHTAAGGEVVTQAEVRSAMGGMMHHH